MSEKGLSYMNSNEYSLEEKRQAAYALNLCTVSVSQIVDYNDINILDQEYETILNNLNLEHMPKDEALLDILRRLLDTIAFFRIQEGDKKFIEREYELKMKNAIWNAVPNPTVILAGGNPLNILFSAVMNVGVGYMNYRKSKAQNELEKDKKKWELQKSAMEQFEGLQQQLFVTAWRLADNYQFPDEFRLTEKQIKQYNSILMDPDEIRKYERLISIKDKFEAYPPFWYYLGNTANSISNRKDLDLTEKDKEVYKARAKEYFERYRTVNKYNLLREDTIAASCNLEYTSLLDLNNDRQKIESLTDDAIEFTTNAWDVQKLCAFNYLRTGAKDKAITIMRRLINEDYNKVSNAQILSGIYVEKALKEKDIDARAEYKLLAARVDSRYLYPLPIEGVDEDVAQKFIMSQKTILKKKYQKVLKDQFMNKYMIRFNKILPLPIDEDDIYLEVNDNERFYRFTRLLDNKTFVDEFVERIDNISYSKEVIAVLNDMYGAILNLDFIKNYDGVMPADIKTRLQSDVISGIKRNKDLIKKVDEKKRKIEDRRERYVAEVYESSINVPFKDLCREFLGTLLDTASVYLNKREEMNELSSAEADLSHFCNQEGLLMPEYIFDAIDSEKEKINTVWFTVDLLN